MTQLPLYLGLFGIIIIVGFLFRNSTVPIALLLVMTGMILGFIPHMPEVQINPQFVLDIFLPLLLYNASAYSSTWKELRQDLGPVALLSIGHVVFITILVASTIHWLIPEFGWPLAFILGSVISPPDDVAIISIAEKIRMPARIITILKGEAMLNDATALIVFRFALIALLTNQFSPINAFSSFVAIMIAETLYGICLAYLIGQIRLRIRDPRLQMMISLLTPFLAYLPAEKLGGSGVISTVVAGLYIGNRFWDQYSADVRLTARSIWSSLEFAVTSVLFVMVGLNFHFTLSKISRLPVTALLTYSLSVVMVVILGRFVWVFASAYVGRYLFPFIRARSPYPPWQYPFLVSWAGMRGGISLAAALIVPPLAAVAGIYPRDLLIFLVFSVIIATLLIQGLTLPYLMRVLGISIYGEREKMQDEKLELKARSAMTQVVLKWLQEYKQQSLNNEKLLEEIKINLEQYQTLEKQLQMQLRYHEIPSDTQELSGLKDAVALASHILELERKELLRFWSENKINHTIKNKLEEQLDLRAKNLQQYSQES